MAPSLARLTSYSAPVRSYAGVEMNPPPVTDRIEDAAALVAEGRAVVLLVPTEASPDALAALAGGAEPGRVALFIGDPTNAVDRAGAEAMAAELFGHR